MSQNKQSSSSKYVFDDKFELSDVDSDEYNENYESKNDVVINNDMYDQYGLKYFPEPHLTIGQFIMSCVVGILISYYMDIITNKSKPIIKYIESYYKYCKETCEVDDYLMSLLDKIHKCSDKSDDKLLILSNVELLNGCKKITENTCVCIVNLNIDMPINSTVETISELLTPLVEKLIKYSDINILCSKKIE
jgi:hypothetical protein